MARVDGRPWCFSPRSRPASSPRRRTRSSTSRRSRPTFDTISRTSPRDTAASTSAADGGITSALPAVRRGRIDLHRRAGRPRAVCETLHAPRGRHRRLRGRVLCPIGSGYTVFFRYILPLVPIVCLLAAVAVRHGAPWLASRTGFSNRATLALLTLLTGGPALVYSAWFDVLLARTDTRVLAARWLTPRLQAEESLHQAAGPYAELDLSGVRFHEWRFDPSRARSGIRRDARRTGWCCRSRRCRHM